MSGSNSSAQDAARAEPVGLTVHTVAVPDGERRTTSGRLKMLLILLACAAPVVASYFTYFVIRPEGRSNYGSLVLPTRPVPAATWRTLDGAPFDATKLKGQWLLLAVGPSNCAAACETQLYMQRQLREMLGRERDRLDKVWLVTDDGPIPPVLRDAVTTGVPVTVLRVPREEVARWLQPGEGATLEQHLYVVDPMGEWMMRMPVGPDPQKVKRDLDRLLRASASWDTAGR